MTITVETRGSHNNDDAVRHGIASRLRGELAMKPKRISQAKIAAELGITQQQLSTRMTGKTPFRAEELLTICRFVEVDVVYVLTGKRTDLTDWYPSRSGDRSARLLGKNRRPKAPFIVPVVHTRNVKDFGA